MATTDTVVRQERAENRRRLPTFLPRTNILEGETAVVLVMELPGVDATDLDIRFEDGLLKVLGKVAPPTMTGGLQLFHEEAEPGDFARSFRLGPELDAGEVEASLVNGILTVSINKTQRSRVRKVPVRAG